MEIEPKMVFEQNKWMLCINLFRMHPITCRSIKKLKKT